MKERFAKYARPLELTLAVLGWLAVLAVMVWAVVLRCRIPHLPISDPDTWGYLAPAISWIDGMGFVQMHGRGWLYPAFVAVCLRIGSFETLAIVQQILGIISGVFFIFAWQSWIKLLPPVRLVRAGSWLFLVAFLALFICNPQTILFEVQIRPEAIMNIVVFAQLYCVLRYVHARWRGGSDREVMLFGAMGIVLAYAAFELKPSWALAVPITCLPMGFGLIKRWRPFLPGVASVALALVLMVVLLWLPKKVFFKTDVASKTFLPMVLFALHADLINADMHAHLKSASDKDKEFLTLFDQEFANAKNRDHNYETLGFDPDYLMFGSSFFYTVKAYSGGTNESFSQFCKQAYLDAARHNPAGLLHKVSSQFSKFIFMKESTIFRQRIDWQKAWQSSAESIPADSTTFFKGPAGNKLGVYLESMKPLTQLPHEVRGGQDLRDSAKRITNSLLVWELLFMAAFVVALCWKPLAEFRLAGAMVLLLYGAPFGNALTVSIIHALDISRYRYSYGPPLLLAIAAMIVFTLVLAGWAAATIAARYGTQSKHP